MIVPNFFPAKTGRDRVNRAAIGRTAGEEELHMKQVIKEAMGDCSTIGEFRFLLRCQECGRTWHSSPVRFSKAGTKPETEGMRGVPDALRAGTGGCTGKGRGGGLRDIQPMPCLRQTGVQPLLPDLRGSGSIKMRQMSLPAYTNGRIARPLAKTHKRTSISGRLSNIFRCPKT